MKYTCECGRQFSRLEAYELHKKVHEKKEQPKPKRCWKMPRIQIRIDLSWLDDVESFCVLLCTQAAELAARVCKGIRDFTLASVLLLATTLPLLATGFLIGRHL